MKNEEKIYLAHTKFNVSFEIIAFLMGMEREEVRNLYHNYENELKKNIKYTINSSINELNISTRCINLLRRNGIYTIGSFAKQTEQEIRGLKHLGVKGTSEVLAAWASIQPVLKEESGQEDGTVPELIKQYSKPGHRIIVMPISWDKSNGEYRQNLIPDDLGEADEMEYGVLLNKKTVIKHLFMPATEGHTVFGITGRPKGTVWDDILVAWMYDREPC